METRLQFFLILEPLKVLQAKFFRGGIPEIKLKTLLGWAFIQREINMKTFAINLSRLKKIRKDALKLDDYHRPENLSLSKVEIDSVLKSSVKREIVMFLDSNK